MSDGEKANRRDLWNLGLTTICTIGMAVGGFIAVKVWNTSDDTHDRVIRMETGQAAVTEKIATFVPRSEIEGRMRAYDAQLLVMQAENANIRLKVSAIEIEVIKLQREK